jgi:hypothetical protein
MQYFTHTLWIDVPQDEATARGKKRDRHEYNNPQDELWDTLWRQNDLEYLEAYKPKAVAILITNE